MIASEIKKINHYLFICLNFREGKETSHIDLRRDKDPAFSGASAEFRNDAFPVPAQGQDVPLPHRSVGLRADGIVQAQQAFVDQFCAGGSGQAEHPGRNRVQTQAYPNGQPNAVIARSMESGSSARVKQPFVRKAVNAARPRAEARMGDKIKDMVDKIMEN